jgi:hypothetical protein
MLVGSPWHIGLRLAIANRHRNDFIGEDTRLPGVLRGTLRAYRKDFARFTRDGIPVGQVLRCFCHRAAAVRIAQSFEERVLEHRRWAVTDSPSRATYHMGRLAHRFRAADENRSRLIEEQPVGALDDCLKA